MRLLPFLRWFGIAATIGVLTACGGTNKEAYVEKPVDDLYNKAMDELVEERYATAAKTFQEVESQHPYSVWATKSQLMSAYALYEAGNYGQAIIAADRFIQLHPGHRDIAYAYYLKAICYYMQIVDVGRDQRTTELALPAHGTLEARFRARSSLRQGNGDRPLLPEAAGVSGGDEPLQAGHRQLSD